ncbi:MAG: NAD(P)/FAD-dependent oxidoreductase [Parvibaculaceae bacterium]
MATITHLPQEDRTNGWSAVLPVRQPAPALDRTVAADWVVVGAGYAGLAAARRLSENRPGDSIVLIDAHEVGENASGRNSGFAIDLPHNTGSAHTELDGAHRFMRLARAAIDYLETAVLRHGIACDWSKAGKFHAAVSAVGVKTILEPFARELEVLKEPATWIDRAALAARLGSPHFAAAVYTPGCILMNPAALTRGLAASLPGNVALFERSPVVEADLTRDAVTLKTPKGEIRAPKMILAINGYAPAFGFFAGRLLPFAAHASLTRPLDDTEQARLGSIAEWGLTPANAFAGITMRYTRDRRILIRQNIHYCPSMRQSDERRRQIAEDHQKLFHARFPGLPKVTIAHTWTGFVCLSRNGAPGFGQMAPNIWTAVCCNAVGVTKGTIAGLLAADLAAGRDNPLIADMLALGQPNALPMRPLLDIGVAARLAWELWQARAER